MQQCLEKISVQCFCSQIIQNLRLRLKNLFTIQKMSNKKENTPGSSSSPFAWAFPENRNDSSSSESPNSDWGTWDPYDFEMDMYNPHMLDEREDDFRMLKKSDPCEYYCGLRREWEHRYHESNMLMNELEQLGAPKPRRFSVWMERRDMVEYEIAVKQIRKENNRMLVRRCRYYILKLAEEQAAATNRTLTEHERASVLAHELYKSDDDMPNELP